MSDSGVAARPADRLGWALILSSLMLGVCAAIGMSVGAVELPLSQTFRVLADAILPEGIIDAGDMTPTQRLIVLHVRLPRLVVAAAVGAMLSLAGAQLQGLFRNPLAAPSLIGTSQGALLGAITVLATGLYMTSMLYLPLGAFTGAMIALLLIFGIAGPGSRNSIGMLLLAGIALNLLISAAVALIVSLSWERYEFGMLIMRWTMGGLEGRAWSHALVAVPCLAVAAGLGQWQARDMDLMLEGEESAMALGVHVTRVKIVTLVNVAILTGAAVAVSGVVGFVGLIVPHMVRMVLGPGHRGLYPVCILTGAWFVILADLLARTLQKPEEVYLGVVTALIGTPFFLFLLWRHQKEAQLL